MEYSKIIQIGDLTEKENMLKQYYTDDIDIFEWMTGNEKQRIQFKSHWEYKEDNKLHRLDGPAIDFGSDEKNEYYLYGEPLNKEDWIKKSKQILRKKKLDRI